MQVPRCHPRRALGQVNPHVAMILGPERNGPEQAVRVGMDARVEVVNLGGEVREVEPTSVEIQSNESERASVYRAIPADVDTLHEAHVGVEKERLDAAVWIAGGSLSPHVRDADKPLEVGDR
jgi:hypothetical protein